MSDAVCVFLLEGARARARASLYNGEPEERKELDIKAYQQWSYSEPTALAVDDGYSSEIAVRARQEVAEKETDDSQFLESSLEVSFSQAATA